MLGTHTLPDIISIEQLARLIGSDHAPVVVDVRREAVFNAADSVLPAARRAIHTAITGQTLGPVPRGVVVYCVHGHNVSQLAAASLRAEGVNAAQLEGGIEAWIAAGHPVIARAPDAAARFSQDTKNSTGTTWVTRRRPKIDRVACPWFIRRFVDTQARFLFVEKDQVIPVAEETGGIAFDVEGAPITHDGPRCSFDTLLDHYGVSDPALRRLADIVRGADTNALDIAQESGGLLAISLGLSVLEADDRIMLERGFHLYDGLYAYLRYAATEPHNWPPKA